MRMSPRSPNASSATRQSPRLDPPVAGLEKRRKMRGDARSGGPMAIGRLPLSRLLTALLCAGLTLSASAQDKDVRLPDLGSSANALISPQEAQEYGASMLRQMRALDMVVDDPMLDDYINDQHVGGFDDLVAADRSGKLAELLGSTV